MVYMTSKEKFQKLREIRKGLQEYISVLSVEFQVDYGITKNLETTVSLLENEAGKIIREAFKNGELAWHD